MREVCERALALIEMWKATARGETDVTDSQLANATNEIVDELRAALAQNGERPANTEVGGAS